MAKLIEIAAVPAVNKTAGLVTSKGVHYESSKRLQQEVFEVPPTMIKTPRGAEPAEGDRSGKMAIVGYVARNQALARCVCGLYEIRNAISWRRSRRRGVVDAGCQHCRHLDYLREKDEYRRTGRNTTQDRRVSFEHSGESQADPE